MRVSSKHGASRKTQGCRTVKMLQYILRYGSETTRNTVRQFIEVIYRAVSCPTSALRESSASHPKPSSGSDR